MATEAGRRFRELIGSTGRPILGSIFPDEFEVYMMTFELLNSSGDIADYLSFPVLPSDITKSEPSLSNVKKSAGGIVSLTTNTFVPKILTINGNFGRSFKILVGREVIDFKAFGAATKAAKGGDLMALTKPFDLKVKTGFGCTKILQSIVNKSTKLDSNNKPYKLFFHNPTLGESYLVEGIELTLRMDKNSSNRIWGYSLSFNILADANSLEVEGIGSLTQTLGAGAIQNGLNIVAGNLGEVVRKNASNPLASGVLGLVI